MTFDNRTPKGEYHIAFNTRSAPQGYLLALKITIEADALPDDTAAPKDLQAKYRVDLCDHPAYKDLEKYVLANPSSKR